MSFMQISLLKFVLSTTASLWMEIRVEFEPGIGESSFIITESETFRVFLKGQRLWLAETDFTE